MTLSKSQKAIVLLSATWAIVSLLIAASLASENYDNSFSVVTFLAVTALLGFPVFLYWGGVWIWGFGYILKCLKRFLKLSSSPLRILFSGNFNYIEFTKNLFVGTLALGGIVFIIMLPFVNYSGDYIVLISAWAVLSMWLIPVWVYLDATKHKIGRVGKRSWTNVSAGERAASYWIIWPIAAPLWLWRRKKLIEKAKLHPVEISRSRKIKSISLLLLIPILFAYLHSLDDSIDGKNPDALANERIEKTMKTFNQNPELNSCESKLSQGIITTNYEYANCRKPLLGDAFKQAGVSDGAIKDILTKSLETAQKADNAQLSEEQIKAQNVELGYYIFNIVKDDAKH